MTLISPSWVCLPSQWRVGGQYLRMGGGDHLAQISWCLKYTALKPLPKTGKADFLEMGALGFCI